MANKAGAAKPEVANGIPLTRAEVEPFVPEEGPRFAYVYWLYCRVPHTDVASLAEAVRSGLADLPGAVDVILAKAHSDFDAEDVVVHFAQKAVSISLGPRTLPPHFHPEEGLDPCKVAIHYRSAGKRWGSNHALFRYYWNRLAPHVGATEVEWGPLDHAAARFPG